MREPDLGHWQEALREELQLPYMEELAAFVKQERGAGPVYPPSSLVFNAFKQTPLDEVKVVIIGQDPYHGPGQAMGLSFSVPPGEKIPPSLRNIYKELEDDLGIPPPTTGDLIPWARQGVLLLNATLTVSQGQPKSHHGRGWEVFTDAAIQALAGRNVAFALWGRSAQEKVAHLQLDDKSLILKAPHPSPFSAHTGFLGCRHFSKINHYLQSAQKEPINWALC